MKNLRGSGRRDFLKWGSAVAAAIGLPRARYLNFLGDHAGVAMADTASCATTARSVHFVGGNGGFAWFQLLWPHVDIAKQTAGKVAFHAPGKAVAAATDKPFMYAPESPFQKLGKGKQISAFMSGKNETHTDMPKSANEISQDVGMIAAIAAIQSASATLIPAIAVAPFVFGAAPGAPSIATVPNASGLVELFNSTASLTLLRAPANATLHEAYFKAFLGLNAAAGRASVAKGYETGKVASSLLSRNLADALKPTAADLALYGVDAKSPTTISEMANALITGVRAFKLGLTSMLVIPAFRDDPHGAFGAGIAAPTARVAALGKMLDGFMMDCANTPDPSCLNKSLADTIVMTFHGDTPKDPRVPDGWPDGTPQNSNWIYVMGNGYLKTGWFGGVPAEGDINGFDPTTGNTVPGQASSVTTNAAGAAAAFAVAKGDMRRVQDFYKGPALNGITVLQAL
jgi:hypothetical protein